MTCHNKSEQQVLFNLVVLRYFSYQADLGLEQCSRAGLVKIKNLRPFNDTTISPELLYYTAIHFAMLPIERDSSCGNGAPPSRVPPYTVASTRQGQVVRSALTEQLN